MKVNIRSIRWSLGGAAAAAAVILLLGRLQGNPGNIAAAQTAAPSGEKIAVVNLSSLLSDLDVQVYDAQQFNKLQESIAAKLKAKQAALKKMSEPLNPNSTLALKPGTEEFNHLRRKVSRAAVAYEVYKRYSQLRLHNRILNNNQEIYLDISNAVAAYAKSHGIRLVLMKNPLPKNISSLRAYGEMVQTRIVLYSARSVDITDKIAAAMNRAWTKAHG
ncbi:MAG: OmpH family outer membrane protein [Phycisphaerae bacterium]